MKVEMHAHLMPQGIMGKAGKYGPEVIIGEDGYSNLRIGSITSRTTTRDLQAAVKANPDRARELVFEWRQRLSDPAVRIVEMDEKGIDAFVVSISPLLYLYWAEKSIGVPFSRAVNESLAEYCTAYPERFFFMATLPMQSPDDAVAEFDYAVNDLGARCVTIAGGDLAGRELDDVAFYPIYERAEEAGISLLVHPYPTTFKGAARHPFGFDYILEYPYQETVAFGTLIYGGVLDRFPRLKIGVTHGGGFVPYQIGRLEAFSGPEGSKAERPVESYLDQFYFDILIHDLAARRFLVDRIGAGRLVVGSNYGGIDSADGFAFLDELKLPDVDHEKIAWENAADLFHLQLKP
jgi:aminocarboxymuconate-semialdehyde decarboxylase